MASPIPKCRGQPWQQNAMSLPWPVWPPKKLPPIFGAVFEVKGFIPRANYEQLVETQGPLYDIRGYIEEINAYVFKIYIEGERAPLERIKDMLVTYEDFVQQDTAIVLKDLREIKDYTREGFELKIQRFKYKTRSYKKKAYCLPDCPNLEGGAWEWITKRVSNKVRCLK